MAAIKIEERGAVDWVILNRPQVLNAMNINLDAGSLEAAIALEDRNQILCANSADFAEGLQAFPERREPQWAPE